MSFSQEIFQSIYGAWRIARFDPNAMRYFNLTLQGFWRSFFAAVLLAPFFLITNMVNESGAGAEHITQSTGGYIIFWLFVWFLAWAVFPIVMIPVSGLLNLSSAFIPFIIAWNWASVLMNLLLFPLSILYGMGMFSQNAAALLLMFARISVFFYGYLVVRASLQSNKTAAIGIVVLEMLLGLLILGGANQLLYGGMPAPGG